MFPCRKESEALSIVKKHLPFVSIFANRYKMYTTLDPVDLKTFLIVKIQKFTTKSILPSKTNFAQLTKYFYAQFTREKEGGLACLLYSIVLSKGFEE